MAKNNDLEQEIEKAVEEFNTAAININWFNPPSIYRDLLALGESWDTSNGREIVKEINSIYSDAITATVTMASACPRMKQNQLSYKCNSKIV